MVDNGISLRVQQMGAENVRARLREINQELKAGKPVTKELKTEVRELSTQVTTQERVTRLSTRAWLDNHRTLQTTARIMSAVGSAARGVLAVTTAFSVASLAFGKNSSSLMEAEAELGRAHRDLLAAIESGDPEKQAEAQENINIITQRIKEMKEQDLQAVATSILNIGSSVAIMGQAFSQIAGRIGPMVAGLTAAKVQMVALSPAISVATISTFSFSGALRAVWAALGPIGWAILGLSIAIPLLIQYWPEITAAFQGFITFMQTTFAPTFTAIWGAITAGAVSFWNGLITFTNTAVNSLLGGIEGLANGFISTINGMIAAYNRVASLLGLGGISALAGITLPRINIPMVATANGFNGTVTQPTLFLTGEKGPERVTVTPSGRAGGGAGGNVYITIQGSVWALDDLEDEIARRFKDRLRDAGFTGY